MLFRSKSPQPLSVTWINPWYISMTTSLCPLSASTQPLLAVQSEIPALVSMKCTIVLTVSIFLHFSGVPARNTISGLLDLSLFWSVVTTGSLILFLWTFGCKLLVIFYTQVGRCFQKIPTHSEKILQYDSVSLSPSLNLGANVPSCSFFLGWVWGFCFCHFKE